MDYENNNNPSSQITDEKNLRLLSVHKVSKILGIRHDSVLKMIRQGKIKFIRIGQRIKIPYINLIRFIDDEAVANKPNVINIPSIEETSRKIDELFARYTSTGYN